jgi:hypothetical protein
MSPNHLDLTVPGAIYAPQQIPRSCFDGMNHAYGFVNYG